MNHRVAEVQQSPMLSALSQAGREKIVSSVCKKTFLSGETVFPEDGPAQRISTNRNDNWATGKRMERRKIVASYLAPLFAPDDEEGGLHSHEKAAPSLFVNPLD
jgi:hypothetical protein